MSANGIIELVGGAKGYAGRGYRGLFCRNNRGYILPARILRNLHTGERGNSGKSHQGSGLQKHLHVSLAISSHVSLENPLFS